MTPYARGVDHALRKFAVDADSMRHVADLAGLGLLSVPVLHHLLSDPEKTSPGTQRVMAGTELAGLGLLAAPTIHHLMRS